MKSPSKIIRTLDLGRLERPHMLFTESEVGINKQPRDKCLTLYQKAVVLGDTKLCLERHSLYEKQGLNVYSLSGQMIYGRFARTQSRFVRSLKSFRPEYEVVFDTSEAGSVDRSEGECVQVKASE